MPRAKALSQRQMRSLRKRVEKRARTPAEAIVLKASEPTGLVAQERVRDGVSTQQALIANAALAQDAQAGLAVGRLGPVDLKAQVAAEFDVGQKVDRTIPGLPFQAGGRDGLLALHRSKTLTDTDLKAGLAFRLAYEGASRGIGSCLGRAGEGGGSSKVAGLARSAAELQRAYLLARLNQMELAVGGELQDGRELHVLRLVAGEGRTMREVAGSSGHSRALATAALVRALECVARVLRITGQ